MNKQELIKHFEDMPYVSVSQMGKKSFIDMIEKLDEPQKVTIPQFVAEIIEYYKKQNATLYDVLREKNFNKQYNDWLLNELDAYDKVARAWLDGYEVEKEPKYTVKFKATKQYLSNDELGPHFDPSFRSNFTKSDLEKLGLAEVFNSPLFEVEEV